MTVEFITLSNRPEHHQKLAASIPLLMGNVALWNLTIVDGNRYDLFSGYNQGASQTSGDVLVFLHDDTQFLGNPLTVVPPLKAMDDPTIGFIGVAGTRLLEADGRWWGGFDRVEVHQNSRGMVFHPYPDQFGLQATVYPKPIGLFGHVVVLDGVLLMCHRRTFDRLGGFDDKSYKGFDFYDIDITFRATVQKLINVACPIPLLHAGARDVDEKWEANRLIFVRKFGHLLPARIAPPGDPIISDSASSTR